MVDEDPPRALGDQALSLAVERVLEGKRDEAWRAFDAASREIDRQKDALLDEISQRLEQKLDEEPLFTVRWRLT